MKIKLLFTITITLFLNSFAKGQTQFDNTENFITSTMLMDSLIIERVNGQKIRLSWPYRRNIKKNSTWLDLIDDFQTDFKKVVDNIPKYEFYEINYVQKKNLVVNEVVGKETYTINSADQMDNLRANRCKLIGKKLQISIEFDDAQELLDASIKTDIEDAIEKIKHRFYISTGSMEKNYYSVEQASLMPKPKPKLDLFVPIGARLGVLRNKPNIELRTGLGLAINKNNYITLDWSFVSVYNEEINRTEFNQYVGITTSSLKSGFGSEFGIKIKNGIDGYDGLDLRSGIFYRTNSNLTLGTQYYVSPRGDSFRDAFDFGFYIGWGF